jgi:hypothetical protein
MNRLRVTRKSAVPITGKAERDTYVATSDNAIDAGT